MTPPAPAPRQMALDLVLPESHGRDDFLPGDGNRDALALIDAYPDWPGRAAALVGPAGSGKSHLGAIWADLSGARRVAARDLSDVAPIEALATGALLVEDAGPRTSELALFHLLNTARETGAFVLLTARQAPTMWGTPLRDLASRLRALPVVTLAEPDEALLRAVMVKLFADRQMTIEADVIEYLIRRMERSLDAARRLVAALDRETLETGRRPTKALAAAALDRIIQPELF